MNKYSTRNKQGVDEKVSILMTIIPYLKDGDDGGKCVQLRELSLCLEARVCGLHYTITLYSVYCAVQRVMAWEGACKQSSNITAVFSSQCYHHHHQ